MTTEQFDRERNYRASIAISKMLLTNGLISNSDFMKINTMLIDKYHPIIGSL